MKKIDSWKLIAYDVEGNEIILSDIIGNWLAQEIDDWITDLEMESEEE